MQNTGGDLVRRSLGVPASRSTRRVLHDLDSEARTERAAMRALTSVGEEALFDVLRLQQTFQQLELSQPAASGELHMVYSITARALAQRVQRFSERLDG